MRTRPFTALLASTAAAAALALSPMALPPTSAVAATVSVASWSTQPAADAIARLFPGGQFSGLILQAEQQDSPGVDHIRVGTRSGKLLLGGTSNATILRALDVYLGQFLHADVSWNGQQVSIPSKLPLPKADVVQAANVKNRYYGNDTEDGYTGAYRTWNDWQHEIDVLALHGINEVFMPVGTEAVYDDTLQDFGYSDAEARAFIPLPGHEPWWLLGGLQGSNAGDPGPISRQLVDRRAALGKQIVSRLQDLGIKPVLPGFTGYVPNDFVTRNPAAHVLPQTDWCGYVRPSWLDPTNDMYAKVAAAFYRHSADLLGTASMYKMDPLHEAGTNTTTARDTVDLKAVSVDMDNALQTARPGAIWVLLGWQTNPLPETIAAVDHSHLLVLDGISDRMAATSWHRDTDWQGTPWAFGSIWNYGGHTTMGANFPVWNQRYWATKATAGTALDGIAVLPEGGDNNPVAFDFLTQLAWASGPQDMTAWFADWATRRYGAADPAATKAWQTLGSTAYAMTNDTGFGEAQDSIVGDEPKMTSTTAASWSPGFMRYDASTFATALKDMLGVASSLQASGAYRYDLMDVARQVLDNDYRLLLPRISAAFNAGDLATYDTLTKKWMDMVALEDRLMGTNAQTMLGPWLEEARASGATSAESDDAERDARHLVSVWGTRVAYTYGSLGDYANREWNGLLGTFYGPRWKSYFDEMRLRVLAGATDSSKSTTDWYGVGDTWSSSHGGLQTAPSGDVVSIAGEVLTMHSGI